MIKNIYKNTKNTYKKLPALLLLVVIALCICGAASSYSYGAEPADEKVTVHYYKNFGGSTDMFTYGNHTPGGLFTVINTRSAGFYITNSNYEFKCWNTEFDGSGQDYYPGYRYTITDELVLYAQWRYIGDVYYDIVYDGNTGSGSYMQPGCIPDEQYEVIDPAQYGITKERNTFVEWNTERDGSGRSYKLGEKITASQPITILYAIWEYNSTQYYTVIYNASGGYGSHVDELILPGESYEVKTAEATGISLGPIPLNGWKDSNGNSYDPGDKIIVSEIDAAIDGVLILYADWAF